MTGRTAGKSRESAVFETDKICFGGALFRDRKDAGEKLAKALERYGGKDTVVLAIPKGGLEVGYRVAQRLGSEFSVIITRKLPFPGNPEAGFGAVAEDGSFVLLEGAMNGLSGDEVDRVKTSQVKEIQRRVRLLRKGSPLPVLAGRTVLLVDDGIAMGSTMMASVKLCRKAGAGKVVVAAPVAGSLIAGHMEHISDDTVILERPVFFRAVADHYENWYDVTDEEALAIIAKAVQRAGMHKSEERGG